ncbi:MAG TPA: hypothetical protein VHN78_01015 [Chloroflexota bacterium]|nr:hypothetical protein [Chloroflexota bacterium]
MRSQPSQTARLLPLVLTAAAALAGATLAIAGVDSPLTGPLALLFLLLGPALATWPMLPRLTPLARAIVAGSMSFVVDGIVAQLMLSFDMWSPRRGVAAVALCCVLLLAADLFLATRRQSAEAQQEAAQSDDEDWLFEG